MGEILSAEHMREAAFAFPWRAQFPVKRVLRCLLSTSSFLVACGENGYI